MITTIKLIYPSFTIFFFLVVRKLEIHSQQISSRQYIIMLVTILYREYIQMATRYMKRCLTSLIIMEIQSENTMMYRLIPVRMNIIKKSKINVSEDVELFALLVQM